jgi:hypothetical protein
MVGLDGDIGSQKRPSVLGPRVLASARRTTAGLDADAVSTPGLKGNTDSLFGLE